MAKKKPILNPKRPEEKKAVLSQEEEAFITGQESDAPISQTMPSPKPKKEKNKGYPISMPPSFYEAVKEFAQNHPEQGTISSIFVRGASMLMNEVDNK